MIIKNFLYNEMIHSRKKPKKYSTSQMLINRILFLHPKSDFDAHKGFEGDLSRSYQVYIK